MSRVPEWFIGGPLHGKDRLAKYPRATANEIRYPHFEHFDAADPFNERATVTEYSYGRTKFAIGRTGKEHPPRPAHWDREPRP